jgi:hypothetical protein
MTVTPLAVIPAISAQLAFVSAKCLNLRQAEFGSPDFRACQSGFLDLFFWIGVLGNHVDESPPSAYKKGRIPSQNHSLLSSSQRQRPVIMVAHVTRLDVEETRHA